MTPRLILIGPPGAGKSSIGRQLGKAMNLPFVDTDRRIEEEVGKKISDIFLEEGEKTFREYEKKVVLSEIEEGVGIVALGGGSILDPEVENRLESLKDRIIYLEVSISNAAPRVGFNKERPLLAVNPRQQWIALMEKRRPLYEKLGGFRVSTDNKKPSEVVKEIERLLS